MLPIKKTAAAGRAKAKPRTRVVQVDDDYEAPSVSAEVITILRNLSEIAYNNQSMLANIVTNQAVLLRTIESQNNNQARMTELIAATLKIIENDSRSQQGAFASLEAAVKKVGTPDGRVSELESQTAKIVQATHDLAKSSQECADALKRVVGRLG